MYKESYTLNKNQCNFQKIGATRRGTVLTARYVTVRQRAARYGKRRYALVRYGSRGDVRHWIRFYAQTIPSNKVVGFLWMARLRVTHDASRAGTSRRFLEYFCLAEV